MKTTRKNFIKTSLLITGGILLEGNKFFVKAAQQISGFRNLNENIGIYTEKGGTIAWYVNDDAVVVIDAQMDDSVRNFYKGLKNKTSRRINFLINTHHHRDHTGGNHFLREFTDKIVGHEKCREMQQKFYGNSDTPQAYADIVFENEWTVDLGKEKIHAIHFNPAHTAGDIAVRFVNSNIVHMGDVVFNNTYPYIDFPGGSNLYQWIEFINKTLALYDDNTTFIFGHANNDENVIGKKESLLQMKNYLTTLLDFVDNQIKTGKSKEEIINAEEIPGFAFLKERWNGARRMNLESAYEEIIKRK
ncbi:MBL fold metallo-hydrolase [Melioribacter sp. OK-6-Me]|uniref:MBL fold metallo-hydrolase n=1 Tax=unclassified Melioribacter TaxID=2627329 RepID=UPI003ED8A7A5